MSFNKVNKTTGELTQIEDIPIDSIPTQGSTNAVQSGGTFGAIKAVSDNVEALSDEIADMNNVLGAKNLLPNNAVSKTVNGITFTVNSDGSVTVNGTASAYTQFDLNSGIEYKEGKYTLNGCPSGGGSSTYVIWVRNLAVTVGVTDKGSGATLNVTNVDTFKASIVVYSGATVNNLTFYPMLRLASIQDDTYVPYSMTNKQLTDCVAKNYSFSVSFDGEKTVREVLNELETNIENYITNNPSRLLVLLNIRSFALDMNCPVGITSNNIPGGFSFGGAMYMSNGANKIHAGNIKTSNSQLKYSIGDAVTDLTLTKPTSGTIQARCILF